MLTQGTERKRKIERVWIRQRKRKSKMETEKKREKDKEQKTKKERYRKRHNLFLLLNANFDHLTKSYGGHSNELELVAIIEVL